MRIALLHYHLDRGGVASVIRTQAQGLMSAGDDVLILTGEGLKYGEGNPDRYEFGGASVSVIPGLGNDMYFGLGGANGFSAGEELAAGIQAAMQRHWGSLADILHAHNPLIRTNQALLPALRILKSNGIRLLLQNHDFAEDYRPDVYLPGDNYIEDVHYAAVNGRDHSFLRRAGLSSEGTHLLPNAVTPIDSDYSADRIRYLYPVRAMRRKNIGEALLLSLFIPPGRTIALTLPPMSPADKAVYQHWRELAERLVLPVEFEVGEKSGLRELLGSSICVLTTSVKEGFGFSYLDPWTAGRAVIGRRLDYVCRDFEAAGVRFDSLYDSIDVPLVYMPTPLLRRKLEEALTSTYRAFGLELPGYALKALIDDLFSRDVFDFGRLDEELQTEMIETLASNQAAREDLADANPFLSGLGVWEPDEVLIQANRDRVLSAWAPASATEKLRRTYRAVMDKPQRHRLSKAILLELFLDPLKLSLVGLGHD